MNWSEAYFLQAKSDYELLQLLLKQSGVPPCHAMHYLQMCTEKLAKGFLSMNQGGVRQPNKHERLVKFMRAARSYTRIRDSFGFKSQNQYDAFINGILPIGEALETLYPSGNIDRPNPEYPWQNNIGVNCPCQYSFPNLDITNPKVLKFLMFIKICFITLNL